MSIQSRYLAEKRSGVRKIIKWCVGVLIIAIVVIGFDPLLGDSILNLMDVPRILRLK